LDQAYQIAQMRWLLIGLLFTSGEIGDAEYFGYMIGAPTKDCVYRYEVEDNGCRLEVLTKERVRP